MSPQEPPFQNVIVGVDGRQGGRDAIALARILAAPEARVTLAHVRGRLPADGAPGPDDGSEAADEGAGTDSKDPRALLERERASAQIDAEIESVAADSPGRGMHELARRLGADLLVVGSSHRSFIGRVLLGDHTRDSLNGSPCAVAVAPLAYARVISPLKAIGVGYNDSPESHAALALARELAARHGASIKALRVVQIVTAAYGGYGGAAWGDALEEVLSDAQREMEQLDGVEGQAVLGVAGEALAELGDRVDVLVVGSRGYGPLRATVLGSTSHHLAKHARCPLVVLPRAASDDADVH